MRLHAKALAAVVVSFAVLHASTVALAAPALGQVMLADHAHVGSGLAVGGATLFDGDRLATDVGGSVQARFGAAQFILMSQSAAAVHSMERGGARAQLQRGTAIFSMVSAEGFELAAADAIIRVHGTQPAVGQVTLASANEFLVSCAQGALDVDIAGELRTVTAENSYRVVIESAEAQSTQGVGGNRAVGGGKRKLIVLWVAIGAITGTTAFGIWRALHKVSSD